MGREEPVTGVAEFQDGSLLKALVERLSGVDATFRVQKGSNKHTLIGNLKNALDFITSQGVRVSCAPVDIYSLKEDMIMGLLWVLILKFQVKKKADILAWAASLTQRTLFKKAKPQVTDFDSCWQDGVAFAALFNCIQNGLIDESSLEGDRNALLNEAFLKAEDELGIPRLLDANDAKLEERGILTYVSIVYSKYSHVLPSNDEQEELKRLKKQLVVVEEEKSSYADEVERLRKKFEAELAEARRLMKEAQEQSISIIIKSNKDLASLTDELESMQEQLEESKAVNEKVNLKVRELTLKMPFYLQNNKKQNPPPEGTVTLVFTDVQGSTEQWEQTPEAMARALALHNNVMRDAIAEFDGYEVKTEGDAFMVAFSDPSNAIMFCVAAQASLVRTEWPDALSASPHSKEELDSNGALIYRGLRVRMGVHTGSPKHQPDPVTGRMDYFGPMVNRASRIASVACGGQVIVSSNTWEAAKEDIDLQEVSYLDLGSHSLKNIANEVVLFQVLPSELSERAFPPIATPVERERADLASEFATLQLSNNDLKDRFKRLSVEAEEAAQRAQQLQEWLQEMSRSLPTTLADDLEIMSANLRRLLKSQENLMKELILSQQRVEVSEQSMESLQKRLEAAVTELDDLSSKQKALMKECGYLEEQCTEYELEILEREHRELRHQRGLIDRLMKHGGQEDIPVGELRQLAEERKAKRRAGAAPVVEERKHSSGSKAKMRKSLSVKLMNKLSKKKTSTGTLLSSEEEAIAALDLSSAAMEDETGSIGPVDAGQPDAHHDGSAAGEFEDKAKREVPEEKGEDESE